MRNVLADAARRRNSQSRGDGASRVPLEDVLSLAVDDGSALDALVLEEGLTELERLNVVHARLVELRVFAGMTALEAGQALQLKPSEVESAWAMAKAWLRRRWSQS